MDDKAAKSPEKSWEFVKKNAMSFATIGGSVIGTGFQCATSAVFKSQPIVKIATGIRSDHIMSIAKADKCIAACGHYKIVSNNEPAIRTALTSSAGASQSIKKGISSAAYGNLNWAMGVSIVAAGAQLIWAAVVLKEIYQAIKESAMATKDAETVLMALGRKLLSLQPKLEKFEATLKEIESVNAMNQREVNRLQNQANREHHEIDRYISSILDELGNLELKMNGTSVRLRAARSAAGFGCAGGVLTSASGITNAALLSFAGNPVTLGLGITLGFVSIVHFFISGALGYKAYASSKTLDDLASLLNDVGDLQKSVAENKNIAEQIYQEMFDAIEKLVQEE